MLNEYSQLPIEKIRELLLNGKLVHENMEQEDYAILIDDELEMPEPNVEVIHLCVSMLGKYDEYKVLDKIDIDVEKLISTSNMAKSPQKCGKTKRIIIIFAAVFSTLLFTQLFASAMGFDLFGYILDWGKERLTVQYNPEETSSADTEMVEPVHTTYDSFADIPNSVADLIPKNIVENFSFEYASVSVTDSNTFNYMFRFFKDPDVTLSFYMSKGTEIYIQKDDDYFEEYSVNGKDFTFYKNLERYKVLWFEDDILYDMGVNIPIDELKEIVNKL